MFKEKGVLIGTIVTIVLLVGGVFLMSRDSVKSPSSSNPINQNILIPEGEYQTGGIVDGNYLPANPSAKITLVEFGDYECPACGVYHPFIKQLLIDFSGKINFAFRNFPLSQHLNAQISSQAVEAAGLQGKYWQMHDKVYEAQSEWSTSTDAKNIFIGYAESLGLDMDKYKTDIDSQIVKDRIKTDVNDGGLVKLTATPTYYLNGIKIDPLPSNYEALKALVEKELSK